MLNIRIEKTNNPQPKPTDESKLGFGKIFTDHMALINWEAGKGWFDPRIVPFANFSIHPASTCLHYGSEIFEGLKAYRRADGAVQLFRPEENARRMNNSAEQRTEEPLDKPGCCACGIRSNTVVPSYISFAIFVSSLNVSVVKPESHIF